MVGEGAVYTLLHDTTTVKYTLSDAYRHVAAGVDH